MTDNKMKLLQKKDLISFFNDCFKDKVITFPNDNYRTWEDFIPPRARPRLSQTDAYDVGILCYELSEDLIKINATAFIELFLKLPELNIGERNNVFKKRKLISSSNSEYSKYFIGTTDKDSNMANRVRFFHRTLSEKIRWHMEIIKSEITACLETQMSNHSIIGDEFQSSFCDQINLPKSPENYMTSKDNIDYVLSTYARAFGNLFNENLNVYHKRETKPNQYYKYEPTGNNRVSSALGGNTWRPEFIIASDQDPERKWVIMGLAGYNIDLLCQFIEDKSRDPDRNIDCKEINEVLCEMYLNQILYGRSDTLITDGFRFVYFEIGLVTKTIIHLNYMIVENTDTSPVTLRELLYWWLYKNHQLEGNNSLGLSQLINNYLKQTQDNVPEVNGRDTDPLDDFNRFAAHIFRRTSQDLGADDLFKNDKRRCDLNLMNLDTLGKLKTHQFCLSIDISSQKYKEMFGSNNQQSKSSELFLKLIDPEYFWLAILEHAFKKGEYDGPRFGYRVACGNFLTEVLTYNKIENYNMSCTDVKQVINIPRLINFGIINMENPTHRANESELPYHANGKSDVPNHAFYILMENIPKTDDITQKHIKSIREQIYNLNYFANIRHGDIKGDNIIISGDKVYLIDFGAATKFRRLPIKPTKPVSKSTAIKESYDFERLEIYIDDVKDIIAHGTLASPGDNLEEFEQCLSTCESNICSKTPSNFNELYQGYQFSQVSPILRLLCWDCFANCDYQCQQIITIERVKSNEEILQFHGKWPFKRILLTQEFFSTLFSALNFIPHYLNFQKFYKKYQSTTQNSQKILVENILIISIITMFAWIFSTIFHIRDLIITERLDYFFAGATVLSGLHALIIRVFRFDLEPIKKQWTSRICLLLYLYHFIRLNYDWSYTYNMQANITIAILQYGLFLILSYQHYKEFPNRKSLYLKPLLLIGSVVFGMSFEVFDFINLNFQIDAHAIWHLTTILPGFWLYEFFEQDLNTITNKNID
ncbi:Post-GPI attachment to proteins factor 3 [Wickerhamomyces ciferrii]|uniref:Post-GPI attachment to proteins factor 3 n=1 Tax=Wickerhamomyces ciferrii (strain ATCC 14091 / BCRC 22168 / CBS 111 / JCM 3599 / NBRC 0793 / NRRL Y-1031 F-60-10) TaxID=1206466 RepID=K0KRS6_WICCF|nr:Post-GPI attachment to proteins factor 3 [Wickerhamomyces ciferrii]CCH45816.1 Post-GPI attachment to proteins factor 3 [Wickerhamomyces ciferrii]